MLVAPALVSSAFVKAVTAPDTLPKVVPEVLPKLVVPVIALP
jgi:hypothetical protein